MRPGRSRKKKAPKEALKENENVKGAVKPIPVELDSAYFDVWKIA